MPMKHDGLAKLTEELGELSQVVGKVLAYGFISHPDGAGHLITRMEDEMGDVIAAIEFVVYQNGLNHLHVERRIEQKYALFVKWNKEP